MPEVHLIKVHAIWDSSIKQSTLFNVKLTLFLVQIRLRFNAHFSWVQSSVHVLTIIHKLVEKSNSF